MSDIFSSVAADIELPQYLLMDTDVLSALYARSDLLSTFLGLLTGKTFLIDPHIKFEFLRDNFLEKTLNPKVDFIENLCAPVESHQEIQKKIEKIAYNLAKIYAHKGMPGKASIVDIHVGARAVSYGGKVAIVTENSVDFPNFIFKRLGVISYQGDSAKSQQIRSFLILMPDLEKYEECLSAIPK